LPLSHKPSLHPSGESWYEVAKLFTEGRPLNYLQLKSLESGVLISRKNAIISAPTNSGKSLIGWLGLLQSISKGKRAILLEPLRALAQEKADEIRLLVPQISEYLGQSLNIRITTGDYRHDDETFFAPAPDGELIIATPERLEALLRNPDNRSWLESVGAVCVDEAHLVSNPRRGPTLEYLITSLLCLPVPPRLFLLSATLGDLNKAKKWLAPCEVVHVTERYPALHKGILEINQDQDVNYEVYCWLQHELQAPDSQALVFVYQTRAAESFALKLSEELGELAGVNGVLAYHSKMSVAQRKTVRKSFLEGRSRVVVTTSALAMGINLPATHVVVRDLAYPGATNPLVSDLIQMMGRAGRGDQEGNAVVVLRQTDSWNKAELQQALDEEVLPEFKSAFIQEERRSSSTELPQATYVVASLLARTGEEGSSRDALETFLHRSLGGKYLVAQVPPSLRWLENQSLAYQNEDRYFLTVLGEKATRAVLPLPLAAGYGQLLRDLLSIDPEDKSLERWQPTDHLLLVNLLHDRTPSLRRFSSKLADQVQAWCEKPGTPNPSLFREWIAGDKEHSKAIEILGSLGISSPKIGKQGDEWARQRGYQATFQAIVLFERSMGRPIAELTRQYKVENLGGIEERWRDEMLWLLSGLSKILDIRTFFYHLKEECEANSDRVRRVKRFLLGMRHQVYDLQEQLKYCSPLGPLLRQLHNVKGGKAGVGIQTIRKLEEVGISTPKDILDLGLEGLVEKGVRRDIAKRLWRHMRRRII